MKLCHVLSAYQQLPLNSGRSWAVVILRVIKEDDIVADEAQHGCLGIHVEIIKSEN